MPETITDKLARSLEPPATGNRVVWDQKVKGFGIRVTAAGALSFVLNYRNAGGALKRITIGPYGRNEWSVEAARKRAGELKKQIALGHDPLDDKRRAREAETVSELCDRYVEEWLPRKREGSAKGDLGMIAQTVKPKLGKLKVAKVDYLDIDKLHRALAETPVRANRVVALLSKMFTLAVKWHLRTDNPCKGIEMYAEDKRERYLKDDERPRLLAAMQAHSQKGAIQAQTVNAFRLAMLTGARIGECLSSTWDHLDLERGIWTKPSAHTKQKKPHRVPLSAPALQLLTGMQEMSKSDWLFPNAKGDGHQHDYRVSWWAIRDAAAMPDLRVHDLRHSFASEGASIGLSLPMIGALLGHTNPATTARYAHLLDDPLREATEAIGRRVAGPSEKTADVTQIHRDGSA